MFKTDPDYKKRIYKKLETICEDETIKQCMKNRLEIGCTYNEAIEKTLDELEKLIKKDEEPPWWVYIID